MSLLPAFAQKIEIEDASVDFYRYTLGDDAILYFDTSEGGHPMLNAMCGLKNLQKGEKLIMINHRSPEGLFPKIEANYTYSVEKLENEKVKITFNYKDEATSQINFTDNKCDGGCDH